MQRQPKPQGPKRAAAASFPTRMIRSETPLGWSRVRVLSVHCQALLSLGFTRRGVDGALSGRGRLARYDVGRVQKACSLVVEASGHC
jgi:hypothetical protein